MHRSCELGMNIKVTKPWNNRKEEQFFPRYRVGCILSTKTGAKAITLPFLTLSFLSVWCWPVHELRELP